jgi:hypothetical protein
MTCVWTRKDRTGALAALSPEPNGGGKMSPEFEKKRNARTFPLNPFCTNDMLANFWLLNKRLMMNLSKSARITPV